MSNQTFTEEEVVTAKATRDLIIRENISELKSVYMAGEIVMWDEMKSQPCWIPVSERPTPQDKAKELVEKYSAVCPSFKYNDSKEKWEINPEKTLRLAKECAIICVEEILSNYDIAIAGHVISKIFWQSVLTELKRENK